MKVIAAICIIISVASAEYVVRTRDDLLQFRDECVNELHIDADHVAKYKQWQYPNDAVTHCYLRCVFEKFGLFNEKEGFNVENIHHQLLGHAPGADHTTDTLHGQIKSCVDNIGTGFETCEHAYRGIICFFKNNLQLVQQSVASTTQA